MQRPILTHAQILAADLLPQMAELGMVACIQPSFVPTDMDRVRNRIVPSAVRYSYCWKSMLAAGIVCGGGSDAPIETFSPLEGMYDAVIRKSRTDETDVFAPGECVTFAAALWMYTVGAAWAAGWEHQLGRLEEGCLADFVVLDSKCDEQPELLKNTGVEQVYVSGELQFDACDDHQTHQSARVGAANSLSSGLVAGDSIPGKNGPRNNPFRFGRCPCCRSGPDIVLKRTRKRKSNRIWIGI